MNKKALLNAIVAHIDAELELSTKAARDAVAEATHEESRAENQYDTRGLEASYLALGQARHAGDLEQDRQAFMVLSASNFAPEDPIGIGALVELRAGDSTDLYFLGPRAGGTEVESEGRTVVVITPHSPLGRGLLGRKQGDQVRLPAGGGVIQYEITSVS